jgi:hypothetical protein
VKTVEEIISELEEILEKEREEARNSDGHLWTAAVNRMDMAQELLDFIRGVG